MPESYSAPLVNQAIDEFAVPPGATVLDPFCGTGTTLVAARLAGRNALGIEVNPFLCFASRVKTRDRDSFDIPLLRLEVERLLRGAGSLLEQTEQREPWSMATPPYTLPDMPRLERWITRRVAVKVLALRSCVEEYVSPANRDVPALALAA